MKRSFEALSAGVQRKKQKIRSARTIASESASNAIKTGNIPIQDFLASRRFEIKALVDSMQRSREAGVQRAFQSLPRYLRRRAASHNVKRVPRRLRGRALAELTEDDEKTQKGKRIPFKRKRGRRGTMKKLATLQKKSEDAANQPIPEPPLVTDTELPTVKAMPNGKFVDRQRNKTWLPSHLWACKRAKMETKWNFAIPVSPNEKTYRSTHRASTSKGAIVFDTSYTGSMLIKGPADSVALIVEKLTGSRDACGLRSRKGQRVVSGHIFDGPSIMCPVSVLWNAASTAEAASVLLRLHPAAFVEIWKMSLKIRTEACLSEAVKLIDLRFQIGSIDIVGPLASNAALSVLKISMNDACSAAFKSLYGTMIEEMPHGLAVPLLVNDPRTTFPPKLITEKAKAQNHVLLNWPSHETGSPLFSLADLQKSNTAKPKSGGLKNNPCPTIPVIVTRTTVGLSLLAPWSYITDFWYSLNHLPLVRFGGLQEFSQIHYERSLPFFPTDYPGTTTGDKFAQELRDAMESAYLRRPPAKRPSFRKSVNGKAEVGDPFTCDFTYLVSNDIGDHEVSHVTASTLESVVGDANLKDVEMSGVNLHPLFTSTPLLPPPNQAAVELPISSVGGAGGVTGAAGGATGTGVIIDSQPKSGPRQTLTQEASKSSIQARSNGSRPRLVSLSRALKTNTSATHTNDVACGSWIVQVSLKLTSRGCPTPRARIYGDTNGSPGHLIGFLTTANFSLSEGKATGLGAFTYTFLKPHLDVARNKGWRSLSGACFVRDVGSGIFRAAKWEVLETLGRV